MERIAIRANIIKNILLLIKVYIKLKIFEKITESFLRIYYKTLVFMFICL